MKKIFITFATLLCLMPSLALAATLAEPNTSALSSGLVGYWPLDGATTNWRTNTTSDLSGQGNIGTMTLLGTTSAPTTGKIGQAFKFVNTVNNYVNVPTSSSINLGAGDFTISLWEKENLAASGNNDDIFAKGFGAFNGGAPGVELRTRINDTQLQFCVQASTICPRIAVSISGAGTWRHIVMIVSRTNSLSSLYVNGVLVGTMAFAPAYTDTFPLTIGRGSDTNFPGVIDDFRIYNRSLTTQEIALLYAAGQAHVGQSNTNITSGIGLNAGLVGYWTMDGQDVGTRFIDRSGNGFNGYLVGSNNATSSRKTVGKIGEAFTFGGQNTGGIDLGSSATLTPARFTIAGWIRPDAPQNSVYNYIFSNTRDNCQTGLNGIELKLYTASATLSGLICNAGTGISISATPGFATSTWAHVAYTYDGSNMRLYKNGVLIATQSNTTNPTAGSFNTYLGSMGNANGAVFTLKGSLDDVRLYNRALSNTEIAQLAAQGSANIAHSNTATQTGLNSGLIGYWTFDGPNMNWKTGQVFDSSGQNKTGFVSAMSTTSSPTIGKAGQALKFNGSTTVINNFNSSISPVGSRTVAAWIKPTGTTRAGIVGTRDISGVNTGWVLTTNRTTAGNLTYFHNGIIAESAAGLQVGVWSFVTATYDSSSGIVTLYANGKQLSTTSGFSADLSSATNGALGAEYGNAVGGGVVYNGSIDDLRIYNRVLSASEVQQLYLTGK